MLFNLCGPELRKKVQRGCGGFFGGSCAEGFENMGLKTSGDRIDPDCLHSPFRV